MGKVKKKIADLLIIVVLVLVFPGCSSGDADAEKGIYLYEQQRYQEAVQELQKAIRKGSRKHHPEEVYTYLGNTFNDMNRYDEAIAAHLQALAINPDYWQAWVNLGVVYKATRDYEEAEACFLKALKWKPDFGWLRAGLGELYLLKNQPDRAKAFLEKAIELDPQMADAHANLALAYARTGEFEKAEAALLNAVSLGIDSGEDLKKTIEELRATMPAPQR